MPEETQTPKIIVAAVAFAVVLYKVVTSGEVSAELQGIVKRALDGGA
nr:MULTISPECIES: DUF4244 domain-containing protein [unclassified Streptomyces]